MKCLFWAVTGLTFALGLGITNQGQASDVCCDLAGCDSLAVDSCDSPCGCGGKRDGLRIGDFVKQSDCCFDDFISPMINFVHFEDPRSTTEVRPIFVNHWVPGSIGNAVPAGGTIQLYAMQFRVRLTERLSFIAVKDGFIVDNTHGALDTLLGDGWADVTAGLKYNLVRDVDTGTLLSVGSTYEIPMGSSRALQSIGDGQFHFFATGGQRFLDGDSHLLSSFGYRLPVDGDLQTTSVHWSNHLDFRVTERSYLFTELAWWHWTDGAEAGIPLGAAGQDLFNLSASDVEGNDLLTQNVGVKLKPRSNIESGIAYEFPLSQFRDVIEGRLQLETIIRY